MKLTHAFLFFAGILAVMISPVWAQETKREIVTSDNADYFGFDLRSVADVTLDQCKQTCLDDKACRAFTYNTKVSWCFLKSDFSRLIGFEGAVAGKVVEVSSEADLGAPPKLAFVSDATRNAAIKFRTNNANIAMGAATGPVTILVDNARQALFQNNYALANQWFQRALKRTHGNPLQWAAISRETSGWLLSNRRYNRQLQTLALAAATNAYQWSRTATPRATALAALAEGLVQQRQYRQAIAAYRSSLEVKEVADTRMAFIKLRREKGFRVTSHAVEADSATPRVCVDFSEDLAKSGTNYEDFVVAEGASSPALSVSNSRLCVEGLRHGSEYKVVLRQGLPAQSGEMLLEPVVLNTYIRDRAPAVRFTGDNFVLASAARRGIPIIGINADKAELELLRVGERSLSRMVAGSSFLKQLEQYSASNIGSELGESIWKGTIDLNRERNREAITSFPIDEALPERRPGTYILSAKAEGEKRNSWDPMATQWFLISDIGLVTYAGNDGLTVFANSLDTGEPLANVDLELLARNNQILGNITTDETGRARLEPGLMRGSAGLAPALLTAKRQTGKATDFVFLDITRAGFDLSDRGVEGRSSPGPLDVFTYLDRGIYRPGETVNVVSLVRDQKIDAVTNLPMTMILSRPDDVEAQRIVSTNAALGGHDAAFVLPDNAMRGVWHIRVYSDPKAAPLSEKQILVEDFVPDRIEFDLVSSAKTLTEGKAANIQLSGRYLYGAPATGLTLEGNIRLKPTRERNTAKGYVFGLAGETDLSGTFINLDDLPNTDADGQAVFDALLERLPKTTLPLVADIQVRMRETGGRAVERNLKVPVQASGPMIGLRPQFKDGQVAEGATAGFNLIALDAKDQRVDMSGLNWSLYRIERNYQWYRSGGNWRYEAVEIPRLMQNGQVDLKAKQTAELAFPVDWGRYKLQVESRRADGPATSILFSAGWYVETSSTETPDALEIALDEESYKPGETARLNVSARHAGELLVAIGADRIQDAFRVAVQPGDNQVDIDVKSNWGAGAYVTATLFKPGNVVESRLPARSIGTKWLAVDPGDRSLAVSLDLPEKITPNALLDVPVSVANAAPGEEVFITVAAVDVGILNLTRYEAPNPSDWYFGQRVLGLEIRDLYGRLIDGSLGSFGRIRSGGDGPGLTAQGSPPTEELMSLFSGVVRLDASGRAEVSFYVPQFNGTARVMAVAWSSKAVGQASGDVIIRDPVLLSASLPKVLAPGDMVSTVLEIHNTDGEAGTYELSVATDDLVKLDAVPATIDLAAGERRVLALSMEAIKPGSSRLDLEISYDGESLSQVSRSLYIRPATTPVATKSEFLLAANGGRVTIDKALLADSHQSGAEIGLHVGYSKSLDVSSLLMRLDRYPYGCAEQTVSRALPLLYLSDLNTPDALSSTVDLNDRIDGAIRRVSNFQAANGGFGLWGPGTSGGLWLDAYISDFLTRAREKNHKVSEQTMRLAVQNLQNRLAYQNDIQGNGDAFAYALYVLARNRLASASDLRYYADTKLDDFKTPLSRAHLAAALSLYNEQQRTGRTFTSALNMANRSLAVNYTNDYYGSLLRDGAAMLALAAETPSVANLVPELLKFVDSEVGHRKYTSTQENAWMVLAARAVEEANRSLRLTVDDGDYVGALKRKVSGIELAANPISVVNRMSQPVTAVVTKYAAPLQPLPASSNGYEIVRKYYRLDGSEATLNDVRQNERFVVVLSVSEFNNAASQVMVSDLLPGGFEVDNPRLVQSAQLENFDWLGETGVSHTEFRKDRFLAAFQRNVGDPRSFNLAYVVRAVTPGRYTHPAASVEDMYRPQYSARTASGYLEVKAAR
ncbi:MAG: alpha-2-macroglobulin family protein [Rhizobiaceae bacterium]